MVTFRSFECACESGAELEWSRVRMDGLGLKFRYGFGDLSYVFRDG